VTTAYPAAGVPGLTGTSGAGIEATEYRVTA